MASGEPIHDRMTDVEDVDETGQSVPDSSSYGEQQDDAAWLDASKDGSDSEPQTSPPDPHASGAATKNTGDDAMQTPSPAVTDHEAFDIDDRILEYAAQQVKSTDKRDDDVAPYIANAERELQHAKESEQASEPLDIFDRIAQAAETEFDDSQVKPVRRVSDLVDDRRVGTKRWTPSKTMKQRMEKLEAARIAAEESRANKEPVASAPSSSTAQMVSPNANKSVKSSAKAETPLETEVSTVASEQNPPSAETGAQTTAEVHENDSDELDALRIVPGARGRRRDRARKSRLDEDFEKIFDGEEDKPSIGNLRRKLRTDTAEENTSDADEKTKTSWIKGKTAEETYGAPEVGSAKTGLISKIFGWKQKTPKTEDSTEIGSDNRGDEHHVSDFEADATAEIEKLNIDIEGDDSLDENWDQAIHGDRRKKNKFLAPLIGIGGTALLGCVCYIAYQFFGL